MRLAVACLFLTAPAFAQPDYPGQPPIDLRTGQGTAGPEFVMRAMGGNFGLWPAVNGWRLVIVDEYTGALNVSNGSRPRAVTPAAVYTVYTLNAVRTPNGGVLFTGAGGGSVTGAKPQPGDPYVGVIDGAPPGATATWASVGIATPVAASVQIQPLVGGVPVGGAGYWVASPPRP